MSIMTDEHLIDDSALDDFDWSWTNQLWLIVCRDDDHERVVRARTAQEAAELFVAWQCKEYDFTSREAWHQIRWVYELPVSGGMTGVLGWRDDIRDHGIVRPE